MERDKTKKIISTKNIILKSKQLFFTFYGDSSPSSFIPHCLASNSNQGMSDNSQIVNVPLRHVKAEIARIMLTISPSLQIRLSKIAKWVWL